MKIKTPKGEQVWVRYNNAKGESCCLLTSKTSREFYFLYEVNTDGNLTRLGKARTPIELEEKFNVPSRMRCEFLQK